MLLGVERVEREKFTSWPPSRDSHGQTAAAGRLYLHPHREPYQYRRLRARYFPKNSMCDIYWDYIYLYNSDHHDETCRKLEATSP